MRRKGWGIRSFLTQTSDPQGQCCDAQGTLTDMNDNVRRPFYAEYAWAFNLLIDRPVRKECATMAAWLVERGVLPGAELLDAGCGTGRHAAELARRGYVVHGIDLSPELIDVARQASDGERVSASFAVGDIKMLPIHRFDAILCRGVLNDFVDDQDRKAVFVTFARGASAGRRAHPGRAGVGGFGGAQGAGASLQEKRRHRSGHVDVLECYRTRSGESAASLVRTTHARRRWSGTLQRLSVCDAMLDAH